MVVNILKVAAIPVLGTAVGIAVGWFISDQHNRRLVRDLEAAHARRAANTEKAVNHIRENFDVDKNNALKEMVDRTRALVENNPIEIEQLLATVRHEANIEKQAIIRAHRADIAKFEREMKDMEEHYEKRINHLYLTTHAEDSSSDDEEEEFEVEEDEEYTSFQHSKYDDHISRESRSKHKAPKFRRDDDE